MSRKSEIKKVIPSRLETGLHRLLYKFAVYIPPRVTPNQITMVGAVGGAVAVAAMLLSRVSRWFLLIVILGTIIHIVADDLDGHVARTRGMTSRAGGYFDIITDVMFSTFIILALGLSPYANMYIAAFLIPSYALINVTAAYGVINFKEFIFPVVGPFEAHASYIIICVGVLVSGGRVIFSPFGIPLMWADIIMILALLPIYFETFRLQRQLFKRLKLLDEQEAAGNDEQ